MVYHQNTTIKKEFNLLNVITKKAITDYNHSKYNNLIQSLHTNNNTLWQFTKKILKKKTHIPPLSTQSGKKFAPFEKAEALAYHFEQTFTPNNTPPHPDHNNIINLATTPSYNVPHKIKFISPTEVKNLINKLPLKKAPGHDKISNIILKIYPLTR